MKQRIEEVKQQLLAMRKGRTLSVCIASTANAVVPDFQVGRFRETAEHVSASFILNSEDSIPDIAAVFDGVVEFFFVDVEVKNSLRDTVDVVSEYVLKSTIVPFRPNEFTMFALTALIGELMPLHSRWSAAISGAGNIGSKLALSLAERGVDVRLHNHTHSKAKRVAEALNSIHKGAVPISVPQVLVDAAQGADLLVGCSPGIPSITVEAVNALAPEATIIDVGNGTLFSKAIQAAGERGLTMYCLTPDAGFDGFIRCWERTRRQLTQVGSQCIAEGIRIITPGLFGKKGDILVPSLAPPYQPLGVCDGLGSTLPENEAEHYLTLLKDYDSK